MPRSAAAWAPARRCELADVTLEVQDDQAAQALQGEHRIGQSREITRVLEVEVLYRARAPAGDLTCQGRLPYPPGTDDADEAVVLQKPRDTVEVCSMDHHGTALP